jgi:tRNA/rRNA methyltransferase/tRNA (cytidine32/uridine32-2'-O)-methyltransferase
MKNFGLSRLRVVIDPNLCPLDSDVIETRSVHAPELWRTCEKYDSLVDAVQDCGLIVGTSRRRGQHRKRIVWTPKEASRFILAREGKVALVFGNERTGLETEELRVCNAASYIPSNPVFPSLNLSHAVAVYLWELYRTALETGALDIDNAETAACPRPLGTWEPLTKQEIEAEVKTITNGLAQVGFYQRPGRENQEEFLRDFFARAGVTREEAAYMKQLILKAAHLNAFL